LLKFGRVDFEELCEQTDKYTDRQTNRPSDILITILCIPPMGEVARNLMLKLHLFNLLWIWTGSKYLLKDHCFVWLVYYLGHTKNYDDDDDDVNKLYKKIH